MKMMKVELPTTSAEENWKRLEEQFKTIAKSSPMELYQLRCMYFQGVRDFLLVNQELCNKAHPILARAMIGAYAKEIDKFFEPENIAKLAREAEAAEDEFMGNLLGKYEKQLDDAGLSADDVPHLPTKPVLH